MQTERTNFMNRHGQQFQESVSLIPLEVLTNLDDMVTIKKSSFSVIEFIVRKAHNNNPMFLSVTRKWQSDAWHGIYIKTFEKYCMELSTCPAA